MTHEQFDREMAYQAAIALARAMLGQGIIDEGDLEKMEAAFREKFSPPLSRSLA